MLNDFKWPSVKQDGNIVSSIEHTRQEKSVWCKVMLYVAQKMISYQVGQDTVADEAFHDFVVY